MSVSLIIPAWNEEESIPAVLAAIPRGCVDEIVVVDGQSTDRTVELARAGGARVVVEPRRGYGRACASGAEQAAGEILVFMDADGADDPAKIASLVDPLRAGQADLALGSRLAGQMASGSMPWHQWLGNGLCAGLITLLCGVRLTDLSPMRAVRKARLAELKMAEMTYGWPTEMIVKAARKNWRLVELPVGYRTRLGGRSKIGGTLKGTVLATYHIFKVIVRYAVFARKAGR